MNPHAAFRFWGVVGIAAAFLMTLGGCGAMHTAVKKRNLDVQTRMSETVFLEPVKPSDRVIYVSLRNTSDKQLEIKQRIFGALQQNGYKITDDPDRARFLLQANILQCGKSDLRAATDAYKAGFAGAGVGMLATRAVGAGRDGTSRARGGLIGGAAGVIGDALVEDVLFSMITDVEIRERPRAGEVVTQSQDTNAKQGTSTRLRQSTSGGQTNWKTYRTRIVSTANKANLEFAEALPELEKGLIRSISGVFVE